MNKLTDIINKQNVNKEYINKLIRLVKSEETTRKFY